MGTYKGTVVTLNTLLRIPLGNSYGCTTLLVCGSAKLELAVCIVFECRYRQVVAIHQADWLHNFLNHLNGRCASGKTSVSAELMEAGGYCIFHMDDFYLEIEQGHSVIIQKKNCSDELIAFLRTLKR